MSDLALPGAWEELPRSRWDRGAAAHLLRRAAFGGSPDDLATATRSGMEDTLAWLSAYVPEREDPVDQAARRLESAFSQDAVASLRGWWVHRMIATPRPLEERLVLFWHGHFATGLQKVGEPEWMRRQNETLRRHARGPFRELLLAMSRDPAMIRWLDNEQNKKGHPNENYARELFELFSLGPGNYGEKDIQEAARAFTGWHVKDGEFFLDPTQHDDGTKTVLGRTGRLGGEQVVEAALAKPASSRFLAAKLFRHFVFEGADLELVEPLAERIRKDGYRLEGALRMLFASRVFYSERARLQQVKSPAEFAVGAIQALLAKANAAGVAADMAAMGQNLFYPPTVKGWDGGKAWISSTALFARQEFAKKLVSADGSKFGHYTDLEGPLEAAGVTGDRGTAEFWLERLLPGQVTPGLVRRLVEFLARSTGGRRQRLAEMVHLILALPEYQLA